MREERNEKKKERKEKRRDKPITPLKSPLCCLEQLLSSPTYPAPVRFTEP